MMFGVGAPFPVRCLLLPLVGSLTLDTAIVLMCL